MNTTQRLVASLVVSVVGFLGVVLLSVIAIALPAPLNAFGFLLPGTLMVLLILKFYSLIDIVWEFWCKTRYEP